MRECINWPKIIALLASRGISQKALASQLGVNQSTISRLAKGAGPEPRWSEGAALIELAGGLGIETEAGEAAGGNEALAPGQPVETGARGTGSDSDAGLVEVAGVDRRAAFIDRRDPNRPSIYAGSDIDRRAPVGDA